MTNGAGSGEPWRSPHRRQPQEPALLAGQERVRRLDEPGERGVLRQEADRPLERRHVVVFPDRHVLVQVSDQGLPPPDHPPAGLAEEGEPGLLDELADTAPRGRA